MELTFEAMLYDEDGLEKPKGTVHASTKERFSGSDALKEILGFDEHFVIRYNANGAYAFGAISKKDIEKKILAVTKKDGSYEAAILENDLKKDLSKSWSLSEKERKGRFDSFNTICDYIQKSMKQTEEGTGNE